MPRDDDAEMREAMKGISPGQGENLFAITKAGTQGSGQPDEQAEQDATRAWNALSPSAGRHFDKLEKAERRRKRRDSEQSAKSSNYNGQKSADIRGSNNQINYNEGSNDSRSITINDNRETENSRDTVKGGGREGPAKKGKTPTPSPRSNFANPFCWP